MNLAGLQKRLLAAARHDPPSDRVPYAFEKRVMAHLLSQPKVDEWVLWARALWSGAAVCLVVTAAIGVLWLESFRADSTDLSQALERTILASADDADSTW